MTAGTFTEARRLNRWIVLVAGAAAVGILYWVSESNYLLFHSLAELGTVIIAYLLLSTALNLLPFSRNYFLAFLGITMASAGTVDIVHALAYKGRGSPPSRYSASMLFPRSWCSPGCTSGITGRGWIGPYSSTCYWCWR